MLREHPIVLFGSCELAPLNLASFLSILLVDPQKASCQCHVQLEEGDNDVLQPTAVDALSLTVNGAVPLEDSSCKHNRNYRVPRQLTDDPDSNVQRQHEQQGEK